LITTLIDQTKDKQVKYLGEQNQGALNSEFHSISKSDYKICLGKALIHDQESNQAVYKLE